MKVIIVNGFLWWLDTATGKFYENEDQTGLEFNHRNPHLTPSEKKQIAELLHN